MLLASCSSHPWETQSSVIMVEGWIESDGHPKVMLSEVIRLSETMRPVDDLVDNLIRWAKVSVVDGPDTVVLTGSYNSNYFPPYIYSTPRVVGRPGNAYTLIVEYSGHRLTSTTTIPEPVPFDSLGYVPVEGIDSLYQLTAYYRDPLPVGDSYQFLAMVPNRETRFYACSYGLDMDVSKVPARTDDAWNYMEHLMMPSWHRIPDMGEYQVAYRWGDTVDVKLARIDEESCAFWNSMGELLLMGKIPIATSSDNLESNIEGGKGFWTGMGVSRRRIILPPKPESL